MTHAIILDTETTGFDKPDVIQLAHSPPLASPKRDNVDGTVYTFKPSKKISLGALSTHHIVDEDLQDCPPWPGKWNPPEGVTYIVGHSIDFDWEAIGKPNVKRICTLALARDAWPGLDSHKLGALIYHVYPPKFARELQRNAHDALVDIDLCGRLLFSLVDALNKPTTWEELWQLSEKARVPKRWSFGKYGPRDGKLGDLIADTKRTDPGYVKWCLNNADIVKNDPYYQKALKG